MLAIQVLVAVAVLIVLPSAIFSFSLLQRDRQPLICAIALVIALLLHALAQP